MTEPGSRFWINQGSLIPTPTGIRWKKNATTLKCGNIAVSKEWIMHTPGWWINIVIKGRYGACITHCTDSVWSNSQRKEVEFTYKFISEKEKCPFDEYIESLGIRHKLIKPATPRHNGKVERGHGMDQRTFYDRESFGNMDDFNVKLNTHLEWTNMKPMRIFKWKSPKSKMIYMAHMIVFKAASIVESMEKCRHYTILSTRSAVAVPLILCFINSYFTLNR